MMLPIRHNINYLVRLDGRNDQEWEKGRGCCPRVFDIPFFILILGFQSLFWRREVVNSGSWQVDGEAINKTQPILG